MASGVAADKCVLRYINTVLLSCNNVIAIDYLIIGQLQTAQAVHDNICMCISKYRLDIKVSVIT